MDLKKTKFLLDENIDHRIIPLFKKYDLNVDTIQGQSWSGIKNGELALLVRKHNYILITRDRDFIFLFSKYRIKVIYLDIHPPLPNSLITGFEKLFNNFKVDQGKSFLIKVHENEGSVIYE